MFKNPGRLMLLCFKRTFFTFPFISIIASDAKCEPLKNFGILEFFIQFMNDLGFKTRKSFLDFWNVRTDWEACPPVHLDRIMKTKKENQHPASQDKKSTCEPGEGNFP